MFSVICLLFTTVWLVVYQRKSKIIGSGFFSFFFSYRRSLFFIKAKLRMSVRHIFFLFQSVEKRKEEERKKERKTSAYNQLQNRWDRRERYNLDVVNQFWFDYQTTTTTTNDRMLKIIDIFNLVDVQQYRHFRQLHLHCFFVDYLSSLCTHWSYVQAVDHHTNE